VFVRRLAGKDREALRASPSDIACPALFLFFIFSFSLVFVDPRKLAHLAVGNLTLVAQSEEEGCEAVLDATLQNMRSLVIFFLGGFAQSSFEEDAVLGIADVLESFLSRLAAEPAILIAGPRVVALPPDTRMQMDELLASLEQNEVVRGTALLLGTTAVHSRMDASLLGHIQNALAARPLSPGQ
jgi:hypothetical protein